MLDEPTASLDVSVQHRLLTFCVIYNQNIIFGYLFMSRDLKVIKALSREVIVKRNGEMVEYGSADRIFSYPQKFLYESLMTAAFFLDFCYL